MRKTKIPVVAFKDIGSGPRVEVIRFQPGHPISEMSLHGQQFYELVYIESGLATKQK
jgi:hypothetical protein